MLQRPSDGKFYCKELYLKCCWSCWRTSVQKWFLQNKYISKTSLDGCNWWPLPNSLLFKYLYSNTFVLESYVTGWRGYAILVTSVNRGGKVSKVDLFCAMPFLNIFIFKSPFSTFLLLLKMQRALNSKSDLRKMRQLYVNLIN